MCGSLLVSPHPASPELLDDVDELLLDAAPPVPLLDDELLDVDVMEPPLPPVGLVWTVPPQDEDAAASPKSEEPRTTANTVRALKTSIPHRSAPGPRKSRNGCVH